ncbi:MAG: hypothetical protein QM658_15855 [Gordonia sp. (in: high G+C Gram-positive bacteria)]
MRTFLTGVLTLIAMVCTIIAVPAVWTDRNLVSADGFASAATEAAHNSEVQDYFADKIADEVTASTDISLAGPVVKPIAQSYTRTPQFVQDFTELARQQHTWLFTAPEAGQSKHVMNLNITPMINHVLASSPVKLTVDHEIDVPIDQNRLTAGSFESTGNQISMLAWASLIGAIVAGVAALVSGRNRGAVLAWLGVGGILGGAGGWLLASYIQQVTGDAVASADQSAQQVVTVVVDDVTAGLSDTSLIVAGVAVAVTVLGIVIAVLRPGRTRRP